MVTEGPFTETTDVIAGVILIELSYKEEAVKLDLKVPDPQGFGEWQIELRQVF